MVVNKRTGTNQKRSRAHKKTRKNGARQQHSLVDKMRKIGLTMRPSTETGPVWKLLPALLILAFVLRSAVALAGDFVLHPDEIMQYLEPAHRAVFGTGIVYWEFFHGARQWLVPGVAATVLWLADAAGLGYPAFYVDAVKIAFCLLSILVPWGIYMYARNSCGELAGRAALLLAVFWYDQIGFAHKPFTEFVSTSVLFAALGTAILPASSRAPGAAVSGALFMLAACVRVQYLPVAGLFALARFIELDGRSRGAMAAGAAAILTAIGLLDWATWGAPFISYLTNIQVNLGLSELRRGESPWYLHFVWLLMGSAGMLLLTVWACFTDYRRHLLIIMALAFLLIFHSLQAHKEYRFIFLAVPLWMIPAAALLAKIPKNMRLLTPATGGALIIVNVLFLLNAMPGQQFLYKGFSREDNRVNFLVGQNGIFEAFLDLAKNKDIKSLFVADHYFNTPGYYYLHNRIPFYNANTISQAMSMTSMPATNLVTNWLIPPGNEKEAGAEKVADYGDFILYRNPAIKQDVPQWVDYSIILADDITAKIIRERMGVTKSIPPIFRFAIP